MSYFFQQKKKHSIRILSFSFSFKIFQQKQKFSLHTNGILSPENKTIHKKKTNIGWNLKNNNDEKKIQKFSKN